jgi:hypothetical protein
LSFSPFLSYVDATNSYIIHELRLRLGLIKLKQQICSHNSPCSLTQHIKKFNYVDKFITHWSFVSKSWPFLYIYGWTYHIRNFEIYSTNASVDRNTSVKLIFNKMLKFTFNFFFNLLKMNNLLNFNHFQDYHATVVTWFIFLYIIWLIIYVQQ